MCYAGGMADSTPEHNADGTRKYKTEYKKVKTLRELALEGGWPQIAEMLESPRDRERVGREKCGALTSTGKACRRVKGTATDHPGYGNCSTHGGNTKAGMKSAMKEAGRDLTEKYKGEVLRFGGDRRADEIANLSPEQALLEEVRRSAALVRFLEERIANWTMALSPDNLDQFLDTIDYEQDVKSGSEATKEKIAQYLNDLNASYLPALTERHPKTGITGFTDSREWLIIYRDERTHLARTAKMCIDAGVAQRMVTLAEDQGRILATAIRTVLTALNLSPEQAALVPRVVPQVLRAVATDSPLPALAALTQS